MTKAEIIQHIAANQWLVTPELANSYAYVLSADFGGVAFEDIQKRRKAHNARYKTMVYAGGDKKLMPYQPKRGRMREAGEIEVYGDEVEDEEDKTVVTPSGIAIVYIKGTIHKYGFCGRGTEEINANLIELGQNPNIKGVLLCVDSGGGEVAGTETLANTVYNYYRNYKKRIWAFVDGVAGSAAYWIVAGADKIYLSGETAAVGSIGTMATIVNSNEMYKAIGIEITNVYATLSTNKNKEYEEAQAGNFTPMRDNILDKLNAQFLRGVIRGRYRTRYTYEELTPENTPEELTGKMYFGTDAINIGLVDSIQTKDTVLQLFMSRIENAGGDAEVGANSNTEMPPAIELSNPEDEPQKRGLTQLKSLKP